MDAEGLSDFENARTQRQQLLPAIRERGQRKLNRATVAVVGAGGLGSPVIQYLVAAGVGSLVVIDHDVIELSNLNRQVIHSAADVGTPKTASATSAISRLAPECRVTVSRERLTAHNAVDLLSGADVVVDGSDTFETRFDVSRAAEVLRIPVVWGAVLGWDAQVTVFHPNPPEDSEFLAYRLGDLFADSPEVRVGDTCSTLGVMGAVCGYAGSLMALETIKLLTGAGTPLFGCVTIFNGLTGESRNVRLAPAQRQGVSGYPPSSQFHLSPTESGHRD